MVAVLGPGLVLAQSGGDLLKQGQEVYENNCSDCHRSNGEGLPVKFPALKGNAYVQGDPKPVIGTVLNGRKGNLGLMPAWKEHLNDDQIAAGDKLHPECLGKHGPDVVAPPSRPAFEWHSWLFHVTSLRKK